MHDSAQASPALSPESTEEIEALLHSYQQRHQPDSFTMARVAAEAGRRYRAGYCGPTPHRNGINRARRYLVRDPGVAATAQGEVDLDAIASAFLGSSEHGTKLRNIMSWVRPYCQGLALDIAKSQQQKLLLTIAKHGRYIIPALRRLNAACLTAAMSSLLRPLAEHAAGGAGTAGNPGAPIIAELQDSFLLAAARVRIRDAIAVVRDVLAGIEAATEADLLTTKTRLGTRRDVESVAKHTRGLLEAMAPLDVRTLSALVPATVATQEPQFSDAVATLVAGIAAGARRSADALPMHCGRPEVMDPIRLAVEQLALLWTQVHRETPTLSYKQGGFGTLCLSLLGKQGLGLPEGNVKTCTRYMVRSGVKPAT